MGVKIKAVRDKTTQKIVTATDCENGYQGEYICKTPSCNADMSFVRTYEQRRHNKTIVVPSFFKLKPFEQHDYNSCAFNTQGAVEIIARESDSDVLKALNNKKFEFSLQVLHKEKHQLPVDKKDTNIHHKTGSDDRKTKTYTNKGTAPSYIKALKQILTLRAQLEDNEELANIVTLKYQGQAIKWAQFYFEVDDYFEAYRISGSKRTAHPMCFHGVVSRVFSATPSFPYTKFKLHSPYSKMLNAVTEIPSVEIIIAEQLIGTDEIQIGAEILVYGLVKVSEGLWIPPEEKSKQDPKKINFLNMQIWVNHKEQIAIL